MHRFAVVASTSLAIACTGDGAQPTCEDALAAIADCLPAADAPPGVAHCTDRTFALYEAYQETGSCEALLPSDKADGPMCAPDEETCLVIFCCPVGDAEWVRKADLTSERTSLAAVAAAGKLWAIGGEGFNKTSSVSVYDPATDKWSAGPSLPMAISGVDAVAIGNVIHVVGGAVDLLDKPIERAFFLDTSKPSPKWQEGTELPLLKGVFGAATAAINGDVIVAGGIDAFSFPTDQVLRYEPDEDDWSTESALPAKLHRIAGAAADGRMYVFGGITFVPETIVATVFEFDPKFGGWEEKAAMPTPRAGAVAVALHDKIVVLGGETKDGNKRKPVKTVDVYDPETDTWKTLTGLDMPTPRMDGGADAIGNKILVAGGSTGGGIGETDRLEVLTLPSATVK